MALIERTAHPRFTSALTAHELDELYCPTEEDLEFAYERAEDPAQQLTCWRDSNAISTGLFANFR